MMNKRCGACVKHTIVIGIILCIEILLVACRHIISYASEKNTFVVVSMGDSFSSGEGIEPFYGQLNSDGTERTNIEKWSDENWLAHRSTKSWGSMIKISGVEGTMGEYFTDLAMYEANDDNSKSENSVECKWYFKAASGALTNHISDELQIKEVGVNVMVVTPDGGNATETRFTSNDLPRQIDVFDEINENGETVDYVTLTIGGNDVGFANLVKMAAEEFGRPKELENELDVLWNNFDKARNDIKKVYEDINAKIGNSAYIIVAGYPKLLYESGFLINDREADALNESVTEFNDKLEMIVDECRLQGMNIHFVDVESEFEGHEAYTSDAWINPIYTEANKQDLDPNAASSYSIHPNEKGAEAYAKCVNEKIAELESQKGTISGKVSSALDDKAIEGARVDIYTLQEESANGEALWMTLTSDATGHYSTILPEGNYRLEISADNYITFSAYATVTAGQTQYMETLLMVASGTTKKGTVRGVISDATTGIALESADITVRKGWNNIEYGDVVTYHTIWPTDCGGYQIELEAGNYTLYIVSYRHTSTIVNVAVRPGGVTTAKASLTPTSFNGYRIVLTWKAHPRDLDSHMVENDAGGTPLHVYYRNKRAIRDYLDSCILDVDDTNGYGPETITLERHDTEEQANTHYYYYVHLYAGVGNLSSSNAQVKIYKDGELIATRNVPTNLGTSRYWNVFAIVGGEIIFKDTITSTPDTSYAKSIAESEPRVMLATAILATDSDAMMATDSEARLATGSEAIIDTDGETLHDKYDDSKENIGDKDGEKDNVVAEDSDDVLSDGEAVMDIEMNESVSTDEGIASELSEEKLQDEESEMDVADVAKEDVEIETSSDTDKTNAVGDEPVYMSTPSNAA